MGVPTGQPASSRRTGSAYALFGVSLLLVILVGSAVQAASLLPGLAATEVLLILAPAVLFVRMKRVPIADGLRWRPVKPGLLARGVVLGVLAWPVAAALAMVVSRLLKPLMGEPPDFSPIMPTTWGEFAFLLVAGALAAGVCEESLFRGAIQGVLERNGATRAVIITAVLFGVFHLDPWRLLPAAGLGVLLGVVTVRTRSTLPAIVCHACVNATAFTFVFLVEPKIAQGQATRVCLVGGGASVVFLAVALAEFVRRTAAIEKRPSPLSAVPAGLSRRFRVIAGTSVVGLAVLLVVALRALIGVHPMASDALAPDVVKGDRVVVLKTRLIDVEVVPGDVVAFRRDGRLYLRKVIRTDAENVWVAEASGEQPIPRGEITGKMIRRIPHK
jgi:membrane protease YdiL (CAAX protease family)